MKSYASHETCGHAARSIALLAAVSLHWACSSQGGNAAGVGGAPGAGGAGGAAGMTSSGARDCTAASTVVAPAGGLIADFTAPDGGGGGISAQVLSFGYGNGVAPAFTTADQSLQITVNSPANSQPQYLEVLVGFNTCVDASAFAGVEFSISGSFSGCTMKYGAGDVEHQDVTSGATYATGPAGAYLPLSSISPSEVTMTKRALRISFDDQLYGNPTTPIDKAKLIFVMWQFIVAPAAGDGPSFCVADISVDDVRFFTAR